MKRHHDPHQGEDQSAKPNGNDADAAPEESPGTGIPDWQAECGQLREDVAQWQDKYLRKLAEFDNFRKRTRQENEMLRQLATESLLASLLPIMDDFDRMLASPGDAADALRKGVEMIRDKFWAFFEAQGVVKFAAAGQPFDPNLHDALLLQPAPDFPPHTILSVIACGYKIGEHVIRHAQVVVSTDIPDSDAHQTEDSSAAPHSQSAEE